MPNTLRLTKKQKRQIALPRWLIEEPHKQFWLKAMNDPAEFRVNAHSPVHIAIDLEGDENDKGVTSVGLCVLESISKEPIYRASKTITLDKIIMHESITAHCTRFDRCGCDPDANHICKGFSRMEPFRYGETTTIPLSSLESYLANIIANVRDRHPSRPLHLIGWGIAQELRALVTLCPTILSNFDQWTDLGLIAARMSGISAGKKQRSLRDVMIALGFSRDDGYSLQHFICWHRRHDPGMDAARTIGTMLKLLEWPLDEMLIVPEETSKEVEERKARWKRPARKIFPYAVRIGVSDGKQLPSRLGELERLRQFVDDITGKEPVVVTLCPKGSDEHTRTHGWVCFDEMADMEMLVEKLDLTAVDSVVLQARLNGPTDVKKHNTRTEDVVDVVRVEYDQGIMDELGAMLDWDRD